MKTFFTALLGLTLLGINVTYAQNYISRTKFFKDTTILNATLSLNFKKIMAKKSVVGLTFPVTFSCKMGDSLDINDQILAEVRGHFRRAYCYLPPLKLIYKRNPNAAFYKLKELKLVSSCMVTNNDDQNLLKEYMAYKIYNMITERSFRVRLLNLSYLDSSSKKKPITEHAFLIEDISQVAKRNVCDDWSDKKFDMVRTDRKQMTMVGVFEYMIANTDWSVLGAHNTRLIHSSVDSLSRPYVIPYDFDFSGFVNTNYSAPDERLGIQSVRQRIYRASPTTVEQLNEVLDIYKGKKAAIYAMINNFQLFTPSTKKELTEYLDEFYETVNSPSKAKEAFITNVVN